MFRSARFYLVFLWAIFSSASVFGIAPDLVITSRHLGGISVDSAGNFLIPISATVQNQGRDLAGRFKVAADFSPTAGSLFFAPMQYIGSPTNSFQGDQAYIWSRHAFPVAMARTFSAIVRIPKSYAGRTVGIRLHVDSCSGEEFMPDYCRIDESREDNNFSRRWSIRLE